MVNFWPGNNGFHFSNNNITWSFGPFHGKALCGGMVYAAMDYWFAGMQIPGTEYVPREGEALHSYIYDRQVSAHFSTVSRFLDCWQSGVMQEEESAKLNDAVRRGRPVAVCTFGKFRHGHHTLAYHFEQRAKRVCLYDPNFEDEMAMLTGEAGGWRHSLSGELWRGFFIDDGYSYHKPVIVEGDMGWLRCMDCRLLYSPDNDAVPCPRGGRHNPAGSAKYFIAEKSSGEQDWRKCSKCRSLYNEKNSTTCLCAAGGLHAPVAGKWFSLATAGEGQGNWRRCQYCDGLFWLSGGGIGGICAAGGKHLSDESAMYVVAFEAKQ